VLNVDRKLEVSVTNRTTGLTAEYGSKENASNPLHIKFRFARTGRIEEPDTAQITINNADLSFYTSVEKAKTLFVEVNGGYDDNTGLLFSGVVTDYTVGRVQNTTEIKLVLGDSIQDVVFKGAYTKQTNFVDILKDMGGAMFSALVELPAQVYETAKKLTNEAISSDKIDVPKKQKDKRKKKGFTVLGKLGKSMNDLLNPRGLEADIINNELVIRKMFAESDTAVELAPYTGLKSIKRNFVTLKNAKGKKIEVGGIEFECQLIPNLYPSKTVQINAKTSSGDYISDEKFTITELKGTGGNKASDMWKMTGVAHEKVE